MKIYTYTCSEPRSDAGYVDIIIIARSEPQARRFLSDHLKEKGRLDLVDKLRISSVPCNEGVLSSNVEKRPI